jgi:hypothetical protein
MESFLLDPVIGWPHEVSRSPVLVERGDGSGIKDLVITVGAEFNDNWAYPATWDFCSEADLYGASKAISPLTPFEELTPRRYDEKQGKMVGSRMLMLHKWALPQTAAEVNRNAPLAHCKVKAPGSVWECVTPGYHPAGIGADRPGMPDPTRCTLALRDLAYYVHKLNRTGMMTTYLEDADLNEGTFRVDLPSVSYGGVIPVDPAPNYVKEFEWSPAIFMALPISGFEFCKKPDQEQKDRLEGLGFQVAVLDY